MKGKYLLNLILGLIAAIIVLVFAIMKPNLPAELHGVPLATNYPPAGETSEPLTTTLFFAGDIMLSRNVGHKITLADDPTLPFKKTADVSKTADIAFANLESPFNDQGPYYVDGSLVFDADPKNIAGLTFAGFDILSTANNHALDQGTKGLNFTINWLKQHGIIPVGSFSTKQDFDPSQNVISKNDIAFGFLSYSYTGENNGGQTISPLVADFNNLDKLKQDIIGMRGHFADVVIVNMHAGTEYVREPTEEQVNFAHAAIDAGADLVIGGHPHWIQTVEEYKDKWIFYSLGNFGFDQMWSIETRQGLTLLVTYKNSELIKIELKPVIIDDYSTPRWATADETATILKKINLTDSVLMNNS